MFVNLKQKWNESSLVEAEAIEHGDMPGDKVHIEDSHKKKADRIFPILLDEVKELESDKIVIAVCGGSGVGKSEIASLLTHYFRSIDVGCYTLSGDNYPHRIPYYNDAERLRIFRKYGIKGLVKEGEFSQERYEIVKNYQIQGMDADRNIVTTYPWYESYLRNGQEGLRQYLGSKDEIDFKEVENIIMEFKAGQEKIWLKRMGREETELWYEEIDFSNKNILIIEWTHGNSQNYAGVDIPILLHSTPAETLEHRRHRNRDGSLESPFTTMVLELEQTQLTKDASRAKIIVSKQGTILSYEQYCQFMN